jgi:hypothetical protein
VSTISIVVISVLAAIFAFIIIAAIAVLIWLLIRQHRLSLSLDRSNLELQSAIAKSLADHSSTLSLLSKEISTTLELHRSMTDAQISKIRGEEISVAVKQFVEIIPRQAAIANRVEQAFILLTRLAATITGEADISGSAIDRARDSGLLPDSYATAAPGEHYVTRSRVAEGDAAALAEESTANTSTSLEPFDDET